MARSVQARPARNPLLPEQRVYHFAGKSVLGLVVGRQQHYQLTYALIHVKACNACTWLPESPASLHSHTPEICLAVMLPNERVEKRLLNVGAQAATLHQTCSHSPRSSASSSPEDHMGAGKQGSHTFTCFLKCSLWRFGTLRCRYSSCCSVNGTTGLSRLKGTKWCKAAPFCVLGNAGSACCFCLLRSANSIHFRKQINNRMQNVQSCWLTHSAPQRTSFLLNLLEAMYHDVPQLLWEAPSRPTMGVQKPRQVLSKHVIGV